MELSYTIQNRQEVKDDKKQNVRKKISGEFSYKPSNGM
jgi:hypothetical protein